MNCSHHILGSLIAIGLLLPTMARANFVLNGDFEDGLNNWQWFGDGISNVASQSTDTPSGSGFSADIDVTEVLGLPWFIQDVPVTEGDELVFTATVKEVRQFMPDFDAWIAAQVWMLPNSESGVILSYEFTTFTDPNWETKGFDITVPVGATIARVLFNTQDPDFGVGTGQYRIDDVRLELASSDTLYGDYNDDDVVDAADYTVWRDNTGTDFALPNRHPDNMGMISDADYDVWKLNFGMTLEIGSGSLANGAVAPEPSSLVTVGTILVAAIARRYRSAARRI